MTCSLWLPAFPRVCFGSESDDCHRHEADQDPQYDRPPVAGGHQSPDVVVCFNLYSHSAVDLICRCGDRNLTGPPPIDGACFYDSRS